MAMLKAKQIKLTAAGDLLLGGVDGKGTVLSAGTTGQFLKVTGAGTLAYVGVDSADVAYGQGTVKDTLDLIAPKVSTLEADVDALETRATAIETLNTTQDGLLAGLRTDVDAADVIIGNIVTASGLAADGTLVAFTGTTYLNSSASLKAGLTSLDTALAALAQSAANDTFTNTGTGARALTSTKKDDAINEVFSKANIANTAVVNPTVNDDSAAGYKVGDVWINGVNAFVAIDVAAGAAVWTRIDQNLNAALFTFKGTADASEPSEGLAALEQGVETGDTFKVTVAGDFSGALGFSVNAGDFIVWTGAAWDKLDGSDTQVQGTAGKIAVSGNSDTGYTLTIDSAYTGQASITTVGTITTGTWNGTTVGQAFGGTGITTVTAAGDANKVLTVGATGALEYAYATVLRDSAGVAVATSASGILEAAEADLAEGMTPKSYTTKFYVDGQIATLDAAIDAIAAAAASKIEQDFTVGANPDADFAFTLAGTPLGDVAVFFNGIKLTKAGYVVAGTAVNLVDDENSYAAEEGDVISVSYLVAGQPA